MQHNQPRVVVWRCWERQNALPSESHCVFCCESSSLQASRVLAGSNSLHVIDQRNTDDELASAPHSQKALPASALCRTRSAMRVLRSVGAVIA